MLEIPQDWVPVPRKYFPSLVIIRGSRGHSCEGVLIADDFVLMTTHCIDDSDIGRKPIVHFRVNDNEDCEVMCELHVNAPI